MIQPIGLDEFLSGPWPDRACILADLDGCLLSGDVPLPHVEDLFARCADRLWVVSNNSTDTPETLSRRLAGLGLPLPAERILLAGAETLRMLARTRPDARIALFAAPPLLAFARVLGLVLDRVNPDVMVLARDTGLRFDDLAQAVRLVHAETPVILTNPDPTHPDPQGLPVPETGAIWAAIAAAVPTARAQTFGKPKPALVVEALRRADFPASSAVFIGDTSATDGEAAHAAGIEFVLLRRPGASVEPTSRHLVGTP
ncbi:HAD-IIA family hydrolase [Palleronia sp.]|uniref:HAD-IIA family hydrolase n=1 Tax=Palleronia sp. TaxID=1940284 RepID=UPI0035C7AC8C